jgi:hypothetical protein
LARTEFDVRDLAKQLRAALDEHGVASRVVVSSGQCGGGSLPGVDLPSAAVEVLGTREGGQGKASFAEWLHAGLLHGEIPVLAVLREGRLLLDMLAVFPHQISMIADAVARVCGSAQRS